MAKIKKTWTIVKKCILSCGHFCEITVGVTGKNEGNLFKNIKTFYPQTGSVKKLFRKKFTNCNKLIKCSLTTCINKLFMPYSIKRL